MDPRTTNRAPSSTPTLSPTRLRNSQHRWGGPSDVHRTQLGNCATIHTITTVRLDDVNKCYYMCYTVGVITNNPTVSHNPKKGKDNQAHV